MNTKTQTWHAERDDFLPATRMHRWHVKGNDGAIIAAINHKSDAVARERAALIAAAPALLAALEALKKATFNPGMQYNLLSAARDQAKAAIELAKGHQGHAAGSHAKCPNCGGVPSGQYLPPSAEACDCRF